MKTGTTHTWTGGPEPVHQRPLQKGRTEGGAGGLEGIQPRRRLLLAALEIGDSLPQGTDGGSVDGPAGGNAMRPA